ncbi:hypothetical protein 12Stean4476_00055 [Erwinia phage Stean]|nr:hypothetical protein 12Stean4476_00055 [Erwinia phage Stean]
MRTARDLFEKAGILLNDTGEFTARRTSLQELCGWLNDGLTAIVLQKPSATAQTTTLKLAEGTLQELPAGFTSILRPVRNVRGDKSDRQPRKVLSVVSNETINAIKPGWHDSYSVPFAQQVKHFIFDEANPKAFYVYPGNDGTGYLEAVLSAVPAELEAKGEPEELSSYEQPIPLDDIYFGVLLDYIIYRARSKDAQESGNAQRASLHYQQFANALGIQVTVETNMSPNNKAGVGGGAVGVTQQ